MKCLAKVKQMIHAKTIYNNVLKCFMHTIYITFNNKYYKNIAIDHNNFSIIMGSEVKI